MKELFKLPEFWITLGVVLIVGGIVLFFIIQFYKDEKKRAKQSKTPKLFIVATTLTLLFMTCGYAQAPAIGPNKVTAPPAERVLVADETEVVASGKTKFRIITSNDSIAHMFMRTFETDGMEKFVYTKKKDTRTKTWFWERDFYFKNEMWNTVASFINKYCK